MILGAIADDLTGATDLSLILSRNGMRVVQVIGVPDTLGDVARDADVVVVALKSRTIPAAEAIEMSLASARALQAAGAKQLFFKYCSTFDSTDDGNIGQVTTALMEHLGTAHTLACPSFPENGRTVYKGHLFVFDQLISESPMRDHPLTPMCDPNLVRVLSRQSNRPVRLVPHETVRRGAAAINAALLQEPGICIVDAITDSDLRAIGRAAAQFPLVTGGSAVAMGLPDLYRENGWIAPAAEREAFIAPEGRGVILAGSCSAMTRRQIATAEKAGMQMMQLDALRIASGEITPELVVAFAETASQCSSLPPVIYSSAEPAIVAQAQKTLGRMHAGEIVEGLLARVAATLATRGYTRFISAGGETSGAVVAALGCSAVRIGPEIDPGVPWVLSVNTERPLCLALKSGNFGSEDFFLKAWEMLAWA
ncbi:3-oxo-tetronate kinase [Pseudotabrizicola alkalilacus]|uniref:3-oxo-tetronate kinase n=1 Tax=Pseudotabrizicola alkalilacus TaxID=2305252 RepID=A0A411YWP2_9RHOB|nr:3-oxo-tetronate kinase [Pseudotabrizicola alkalilacus]RGP35155.1 four-carbon acid sugar kinase family protein [Pseudotabrizicola alkalilacus]